ncbi:thiamine phosphate synthase [Desulfurispira natronophila]
MLREPGMDMFQYMEILEALSPHSKKVLVHSKNVTTLPQLEFILEAGLASGIHWTSQAPLGSELLSWGEHSRSCHSAQEARQLLSIAKGLDWITLSPIFHTKKPYSSVPLGSTEFDTLPPALLKRTVALGGISCETLPRLASFRYLKGIACIGALASSDWENLVDLSMELFCQM